jgi:hypothetical protein
MLGRLENAQDTSPSVLLLQIKLGRPLLLRTLLGGFYGRAVTMGSLAEELGLPWTLLQRLFGQAIAFYELQGRLSAQELSAMKTAAEVSLLSAQNGTEMSETLSNAAAYALLEELQRVVIQLEQQQGGDEQQQQQQQQQEIVGVAPAAADGGLAAAAAAAAEQPPINQQEQQEQLIGGLAGAAADGALAVAAAPAAAAAEQLLVDQQEQQQQQGNGAVAGAAADGALAEATAAAAAAVQLPMIHLQQLLQQQLRQQQQLFVEETLEDVRDQLLQRWNAGERSIPAPQQVQLGPLPLWQQCVIELASSCGSSLTPNSGDTAWGYKTYDDVYAVTTSGMTVADKQPSAASEQQQQQQADGCSSYSAITPLQRLLCDEEFVSGPLVSPQPRRVLPWGRLLAQAAVELRQPQLLACALQQQQQLWGLTNASRVCAMMVALAKLHDEACSPVWCCVSRQPQQQREDVLEFEQHKQQQLPRLPAFVQLSADVAMLMLRVSPSFSVNLLSMWLEQGLRYNRSAADVARAKAVLAAVAAAQEVPAGAMRVRNAALMRVLDTGDVDLLALFMCWATRVA